MITAIAEFGLIFSFVSLVVLFAIIFVKKTKNESVSSNTTTLFVMNGFVLFGSVFTLVMDYTMKSL